MIKIKFYFKNKLSDMKMLLVLMFIAITCFFILAKPVEVAGGAKQGLLFCGNTLIPSLFPFMFLSSFTINSGLAEKTEKYFSGITKKLFGLPGYCSATIILSLIGGYPVGARGVKALYENKLIDDAAAQKMMCFCVGAGPAFVITVLGEQMLGSKSIGIMLFVSQVISGIILGICVNIKEYITFYRNPLLKKQHTLKNKAYENNKKAKSDITAAVVTSCFDCCNGILNMCAFVILFSTLIEISNISGLQSFIGSLLNNIGFEKNVSESLLPLLAEVMGGSKIACENRVNPIILSFAICWGGLCVHFQIFTALTKMKISKKSFWIYRFLHGLLSSVITLIYISIYSPVISASLPAAAARYNVTQSNSLFSSVFLILLCLFFIVATKKEMA